MPNNGEYKGIAVSTCSVRVAELPLIVCLLLLGGSILFVTTVVVEMLKGVPPG